jgi:hypothetical protein
MTNTWRADPLVWGNGPRVLEVFLEPTCPFSVRAFGKLADLLGHAGRTASPLSCVFSRSLGTCTRA